MPDPTNPALERDPLMVAIDRMQVSLTGEIVAIKGDIGAVRGEVHSLTNEVSTVKAHVVGGDAQGRRPVLIRLEDAEGLLRNVVAERAGERAALRLADLERDVGELRRARDAEVRANLVDKRAQTSEWVRWVVGLVVVAIVGGLGAWLVGRVTAPAAPVVAPAAP